MLDKLYLCLHPPDTVARWRALFKVSGEEMCRKRESTLTFTALLGGPDSFGDKACVHLLWLTAWNTDKGNSKCSRQLPVQTPMALRSCLGAGVPWIQCLLTYDSQPKQSWGTFLWRQIQEMGQRQWVFWEVNLLRHAYLPLLCAGNDYNPIRHQYSNAHGKESTHTATAKCLQRQPTLLWSRSKKFKFSADWNAALSARQVLSIEATHLSSLLSNPWELPLFRNLPEERRACSLSGQTLKKGNAISKDSAVHLALLSVLVHWLSPFSTAKCEPRGAEFPLLVPLFFQNCSWHAGSDCSGCCPRVLGAMPQHCTLMFPLDRRRWNPEHCCLRISCQHSCSLCPWY